MEQGEGGRHLVVLRGPIFEWGGCLWNGVYRGTVTMGKSGSEEPDGEGDYEGEGDREGYAYSGAWCNGKPCGVGWLLFKQRSDGGGVYAGHV